MAKNRRKYRGALAVVLCVMLVLSMGSCSRERVPYVPEPSTYNGVISSVSLKDGDINCDGWVDFYDLERMRDYILYGTSLNNKKRADLYKDGQLDMYDMQYLANLVYTEVEGSKIEMKTPFGYGSSYELDEATGKMMEMKGGDYQPAYFDTKENTRGRWIFERTETEEVNDKGDVNRDGAIDSGDVWDWMEYYQYYKHRKWKLQYDEDGQPLIDEYENNIYDWVADPDYPKPANPYITDQTCNVCVNFNYRDKDGAEQLISVDPAQKEYGIDDGNDELKSIDEYLNLKDLMCLLSYEGTRYLDENYVHKKELAESTLGVRAVSMATKESDPDFYDQFYENIWEQWETLAEWILWTLLTYYGDEDGLSSDKNINYVVYDNKTKKYFLADNLDEATKTVEVKAGSPDTSKLSAMVIENQIIGLNGDKNVVIELDVPDDAIWEAYTGGEDIYEWNESTGRWEKVERTVYITDADALEDYLETLWDYYSSEEYFYGEGGHEIIYNHWIMSFRSLGEDIPTSNYNQNYVEKFAPLVTLNLLEAYLAGQDKLYIDWGELPSEQATAAELAAREALAAVEARLDAAYEALDEAEDALEEVDDKLVECQNLLDKFAVSPPRSNYDRTRKRNAENYVNKYVDENGEPTAEYTELVDAVAAAEAAVKVIIDGDYADAVAALNAVKVPTPPKVKAEITDFNTWKNNSWLGYDGETLTSIPYTFEERKRALLQAVTQLEVDTDIFNEIWLEEYIKNNIIGTDVLANNEALSDSLTTITPTLTLNYSYTEYTITETTGNTGYNEDSEEITISSSIQTAITNLEKARVRQIDKEEYTRAGPSSYDNYFSGVKSLYSSTNIAAINNAVSMMNISQSDNEPGAFLTINLSNKKISLFFTYECNDSGVTGGDKYTYPEGDFLDKLALLYGYTNGEEFCNYLISLSGSLTSENCLNYGAYYVACEYWYSAGDGSGHEVNIDCYAMPCVLSVTIGGVTKYVIADLVINPTEREVYIWVSNRDTIDSIPFYSVEFYDLNGLYYDVDNVLDTDGDDYHYTFTYKYAGETDIEEELKNQAKFINDITTDLNRDVRATTNTVYDNYFTSLNSTFTEANVASIKSYGNLDTRNSSNGSWAFFLLNVADGADSHITSKRTYSKISESNYDIQLKEYNEYNTSIKTEFETDLEGLALLWGYDSAESFYQRLKTISNNLDENLYYTEEYGSEFIRYSYYKNLGGYHRYIEDELFIFPYGIEIEFKDSTQEIVLVELVYDRTDKEIYIWVSDINKIDGFLSSEDDIKRVNIFGLYSLFSGVDHHYYGQTFEYFEQLSTASDFSSTQYDLSDLFAEQRVSKYLTVNYTDVNGLYPEFDSSSFNSVNIAGDPFTTLEQNRVQNVDKNDASPGFDVYLNGVKTLYSNTRNSTVNTIVSSMNLYEYGHEPGAFYTIDLSTKSITRQLTYRFNSYGGGTCDAYQLPASDFLDRLARLWGYTSGASFCDHLINLSSLLSTDLTSMSYGAWYFQGEYVMPDDPTHTHVFVDCYAMPYVFVVSLGAVASKYVIADLVINQTDNEVYIWVSNKDYIAAAMPLSDPGDGSLMTITEYGLDALFNSRYVNRNFEVSFYSENTEGVRYMDPNIMDPDLAISEYEGDPKGLADPNNANHLRYSSYRINSIASGGYTDVNLQVNAEYSMYRTSNVDEINSAVEAYFASDTGAGAYFLLDIISKDLTRQINYSKSESTYSISETITAEFEAYKLAFSKLWGFSNELEFWEHLDSLVSCMVAPADDSDVILNMKYNGAYYRKDSGKNLYILPYVFHITKYGSTIVETYLFVDVVLNTSNKTAAIWISDKSALLGLNTIGTGESYSIDVYGRNVLFDSQVVFIVTSEDKEDTIGPINYDFNLQMLKQNFNSKVQDLLNTCFDLEEKDGEYVPREVQQLDEEGNPLLDSEGNEIWLKYTEAIFADFPSYNLSIITDMDTYTFFRAVFNNDSGIREINNMAARQYTSLIIYPKEHLVEQYVTTTDKEGNIVYVLDENGQRQTQMVNEAEFNASFFKLYFTTECNIEMNVYMRYHITVPNDNIEKDDSDTSTGNLVIDSVRRVATIYTDTNKDYNYDSNEKAIPDDINDIMYETWKKLVQDTGYMGSFVDYVNSFRTSLGGKFTYEDDKGNEKYYYFERNYAEFDTSTGERLLPMEAYVGDVSDYADGVDDEEYKADLARYEQVKEEVNAAHYIYDGFTLKPTAKFQITEELGVATYCSAIAIENGEKMISKTFTVDGEEKTFTGICGNDGDFIEIIFEPVVDNEDRDKKGQSRYGHKQSRHKVSLEFKFVLDYY